MAAATLALVPAYGQPAAPAQPIPFSHKLHAGTMKLPCKMCHPNPDAGEMMTIAGAPKCMQCHATVKAESPSIQTLAAFVKNDREIKWARVYQIPEFVRFSHGSHLTAGATCHDCHGEVTLRDQLFRETNLSMSGCMDCHRMKRASIDCAYCHDQQPQ